MSKGKLQLYIVEADDCAAEPFVSLKKAFEYGERLFATQEERVTVTEFRGIDEERAIGMKRSWERRYRPGAAHGTSCYEYNEPHTRTSYWVCKPGCPLLPSAAEWVLTTGEVVLEVD